MNIILVYFYRTGIAGIIATNLIVSIISFTLVFYVYKKNINVFKLNISRKAIINFLKIGIPFMPGSVAAWVMSTSDRWFLLKFVNLHAVGIFALSFKFASVYDVLIITPLVNAYFPYVFSRFSKGNYHQHFKILIPATLGIFFLLGLFTQQVARMLFIGTLYRESIDYLPPMIFKYGIILCTHFISQRFLFWRKSMLSTSFYIVSAIFNVALNFIVVPRFGIWGAVYSGLLTNMLWFMLFVFAKMRIKIPITVHDAL